MNEVLSSDISIICIVFSCFLEKICSVHSKHEVHMGSSFQIYCIFKKECNRLIYQDEVSLNYSSLNSTVVIMNIVNLTRTTTFTCKCHNEREPCGTDIVPGCTYATHQCLFSTMISILPFCSLSLLAKELFCLFKGC